MQAKIGSSSSAPAPISRDNPGPHIMSGRSTLVTPVPQQHEIADIELSVLPNEVLALIMRQVDDATSLVSLRTTCQRFDAIYQDEHVYTAHERQYYILIHNLTTHTLPKIRNGKPLITDIPYPDTEADTWKKLKDQPLEKGLTEEQRQIAMMKKAYIITWDLLLQATVTENQSLTSNLVGLLLDLSPHFKHAENYAEKLFNYGLSWEIFHKLANIHLDRCLQMVIKHFPMREGTQAHEFIVTQLPPAINPPFLIQQLKSKKNESVLLYVAQNFCLDDPRRDSQLVELCQMLYERGCDFEQRTKDGDTALTITVKIMSSNDSNITRPRYPLITFLLEKGADCNAIDKEGNTSLIMACVFKQEKIILSLLHHPQIDVNVKNNKGLNALFIAISKNNLLIVQALLTHPQIDVNLTDNDGNCALFYAVTSGNLAILQALLKHPKINVNVINARNKRGESALYHAIARQHFALIGFLLQDPKVDVNARTEAGESILGLAIEKGNSCVLGFLLQHPEIDVNATASPGGSALHYAILKKCLKSIGILLKHPQIDVNARTNRGCSVLDLAVIIGDLFSVEFLLQQSKLEVNARSSQNLSALDWAIEKDKLAIAQLLFIHPRLDRNTRLLAFLHTISLGKNNMAEILLQLMNKQEKEDFINDALALAQEKGQERVIQYLREVYKAEGRPTHKRTREEYESKTSP